MNYDRLAEAQRRMHHTYNAILPSWAYEQRMHVLLYGWKQYVLAGSLRRAKERPQ